MRKKNNKVSLLPKQSQITVFIIIIIIIIILMIYLFSVNKDDKENILETSENTIILENNQKLTTLKEDVDYCLDLQLKRAVIISGLKGGFIYNKGEYYFPGTIPSGSYSDNLISNLNLNWNYLQSSALVHSHAQVYTPGIKNNSFDIYAHTITDDITKFVKKEFVKCLDFENAEKIYTINFTDYVGKINNIDYDSSKIEISELEAEIGDVVDIDLDTQTLTGVVIASPQDNIYIADFADVTPLSLLSPGILYNLEVLNINNSLNITINMNKEDISAQINFPVKIKNHDFETTYEESTVVLKVRYAALLNFAQTLLSYKYYTDKDVSYENAYNVIHALNTSYYFKTTPLRDLTLKTKIIKNEMEDKKYVYSLIDKDSKILGNPFVLNFGYENIAPTIKLGELDSDIIVGENSNVVSLLCVTNETIEYNLRPVTFEKQFWDDYIFYYDEIIYEGPDAKMYLFKNGTLIFTPYKEKLYHFNIYTTDGETSREHILEFITGFPDNKNNKAANTCFQFFNFEDGNRQFPLSYEFKNKKYDFKKDSYNYLFGLSQYVPINNPLYQGINIPQSELHFSKSCVYDSSKFGIEVTSYFEDGSSQTINNVIDALTYYKIPVPKSDMRQDVIVKVKSLSSGTVMTEPFNFTVFPVKCLGPDEYMSFINDSCCNLQDVRDAVNKTVKDKDYSFVETIKYPNDILRTGDILFNKEIYLCYNPKDDSDMNNFVYDYSNNVIWNDFPGLDITSLFEGQMIVQCKGNFPKVPNNIKSINGGNNLQGKLVGFEDMGIFQQINPTINVNLKKSSSASTCEFCLLENISEFKAMIAVGNKNLAFDIGIKDYNPNALVIYLPYIGDSLWDLLDNEGKLEVQNTFVLCDNNIYERNNTVPLQWLTVTSNVIGKGGYAETKFVSKGYCQLGSSDCGPREEKAIRVTDSLYTCTAKYFDINSWTIVSEIPPTTWQCGVDSNGNAEFCSGSGLNNCVVP